jgi:hypothetical protein
MLDKGCIPSPKISVALLTSFSVDADINRRQRTLSQGQTGQEFSYLREYYGSAALLSILTFADV